MSPTRNDSETDWNKYIARRNNEGNNDAVRRIIIDIIIHSNRSIFFFSSSRRTSRTFSLSTLTVRARSDSTKRRRRMTPDQILKMLKRLRSSRKAATAGLMACNRASPTTRSQPTTTRLFVGRGGGRRGDKYRAATVMKRVPSEAYFCAHRQTAS